MNGLLPTVRVFSVGRHISPSGTERNGRLRSTLARTGDGGFAWQQISIICQSGYCSAWRISACLVSVAVQYAQYLKQHVRRRYK